MVSAVLVFSLITVVLGVYLSTIVPDQIAAAEAVHMRRVSSSLADMAAQVEGTITLGREGEFTTQVDLGATNIAGGLLKQSSGSLRLVENAFPATFRCPSPKLLARNGNAAPGGTFATLGFPAITFDSLVALELSVGSYTFAAPDPTASLFVKAAGKDVATFRLVLVENGTADRVEVKVSDGTGVVYHQPILIGPPSPLSMLVNALDPAYPFAGLIADSPGPFTLTGSGPPEVKTYTVYWQEDGTIGVLEAGRDLTAGFERNLAASALVYRSSNSEFMDQTYSLEGGAVVLAQESGEYLTLAPFSITAADGERVLRLSLVNSTGTGQVSGSHRATVSLSVRAPTSSLLQCTGPRLFVVSQYPVAWLATWSDAIAQAGLDPAMNTATLSGSLLTVDLSGAWTVLLHEARVTVRVG